MLNSLKQLHQENLQHRQEVAEEFRMHGWEDKGITFILGEAACNSLEEPSDEVE